jgi:AraC-like DNA-binding protein
MNARLDANSFVSQQVESSRLFFLENRIAEDDFSVIIGGFENCQADYRIDRPDFPWYVLEFVSRGSGDLILGGVCEPLRSGSFYLYGPNMPHRIESSADAPLGKYFVGFGGTAVAQFLEEIDLPVGFASRCLKGEPIRRAFETLIERGTRKSKLAAPTCAAITRQLLLMCRDDAIEAGDQDTAAYASYLRARDFISGHFIEIRKLADVAFACELDAPYLCRLFARFHDESPYRFLTRLRMDHASRLLLDESGVTVQEVALTLGFKDPFHFSRVFKSIHHAPPSRFRQAMYR